VKRWLSILLTFPLIVILESCQALPAVTPTAAEVIDIQIATLPVPTLDVTPSAEINNGVSPYPAPEAYPSIVANPYPEVPYPVVYPDDQAANPYPGSGGADWPTLEPYIFETSQPGTVTIRGTLNVLDPQVLLPAADDGIYLVPLTDSEGGPATIPPIVKGETPQADVDERTGEFVFVNINPGQYAVVVLSLGGSEVPARMYETNSLAIVTVSETDLDNTIDLGHLAL
jgi:hypothetical protein